MGRKTCRTIDFKELFICSYNLNKTEVEILKYLIKAGKRQSIVKIAKAMNKERSTIQRRLKVLVERGLIEKRQVNLETGGYIFEYFSKPKEFYLNIAKQVLNDSVERVKRDIGIFN